MGKHAGNPHLRYAHLRNPPPDGKAQARSLGAKVIGIGQTLSRTKEPIARIPVWGSFFMPALKAEKPWQHLRAMYDFGSPDAKRGPSWQDLYAMYPKPPNCTCKWTHKARILPFRSRKACISGKHCQEEGLLRAFVEKRTHTARFLPGGAVKQSVRCDSRQAAPRSSRSARGGCELYGAPRRAWLVRRVWLARQTAARG